MSDCLNQIIFQSIFKVYFKFHISKYCLLAVQGSGLPNKALNFFKISSCAYISSLQNTEHLFCLEVCFTELNRNVRSEESWQCGMHQ